MENKSRIQLVGKVLSRNGRPNLYNGTNNYLILVIQTRI